MSSKTLPRFRKESSESWAQDKLVVHFAGELAGNFFLKFIKSFTCEGETRAVNYRVYPEAISENSNIICTQLDSIIRTIKNLEEVEEIVFVMDNHSTQKNAICFAYLEWLAKIEAIPKTCMNNF